MVNSAPFLGLAAAFALASSPLSAQTPAAAPVPDVVVVAPRLNAKPATAGEIAHHFIEAHSAPTRIGQLARWKDPVCPRADGLPPAFNSFVVARIKAVAKQVGAPLDQNPKCQPNIEVFFTPKPDEFITLVAKRYPDLLGFHYFAQTKAVATFMGPVEGWYMTATGNDRGIEMTDVVTTSLSGDENYPLLAINTPSGCAHSRLTLCLNSSLHNTLILVDTNRIQGMEIGSLSDYLAMIGLAQLRGLDHCGATASILDLFAKDCGDLPRPKAMSASDVDYLKTLYSTDLTLSLTLERDDIADKMVPDIKLNAAGRR